MFIISKLEEISSIFAGFTFRKQIEEVPFGKYKVIQTKDIVGNSYLDFSNLTKVDENIKENHLLKQNNLLVRAKGVNTLAYHINIPVENTIASSQFFVVKNIDSRVLSEYLTWYINQPNAQDYLANNARTMTVPNITKPILGQLEIIIPSIEIQSKIIKLNELKNKEIVLLDTIKEKRQILLNTVMNKMLTGSIIRDVEND